MRHPFVPRRLIATLAFSMAVSRAAFAGPVPLDDDEMRAVAGQGVAIAVHLELNSGLLRGQAMDSRFTAGFDVNGTTTYAIAQNFGGVLDMLSITLDPSENASGQDYLAIGMPGLLGTQQFGVRAIGVQTDPNAALAASFGSLLLNGAATMTGQLNVWPK
jgi:hypothetical protein